LLLVIWLDNDLVVNNVVHGRWSAVLFHPVALRLERRRVCITWILSAADDGNDVRCGVRLSTQTRGAQQTAEQIAEVVAEHSVDDGVGGRVDVRQRHEQYEERPVEVMMMMIDEEEEDEEEEDEGEEEETEEEEEEEEE